MSANWDVFHAERLETERELSTEVVRKRLADGSIRGDDLVRPAGSTFGWTPILDMAEFQAPIAGVLPGAPLMAQFVDEPEDDVLELEDQPPLSAEFADEELPAAGMGSASPSFQFVDDLAVPAEASVLPPVAPFATPPWDEQAGIDDDEFDPLEEDEEAAEFTLSRSGPETIEELDLAAMVDVAFQLVLFFLVTATTILYKSLEVPKPNNDAPPEAAVQARGKTLDDMKANFIVIEIDAAGGIKLDHEPLPDKITLDALADRLRTSRKDTDRTAMLLSADFSTPHKNAVLAYDAANEIGLRIAIAKPTNAPPDPAKSAPPRP